jgi:N-acetylneuraminate synthase
MSAPFRIGKRAIGPGQPTYIIAELSANHNQDFGRAVELIRIAKEAGADAVKIQTYTPDTLTIESDAPWFRVQKGTIWEGKTLYGLYKEAYTPWDWQPKLAAEAARAGLDLFSSPFDSTAVDFLEKLGVPAYKIASFELVDLPLIRYVAARGKPVILSTGMANEKEIDEAVQVCRAQGVPFALLRCNSGYPAPPEEMDLRTIPDMAARWKAPIGLSDHSLGKTAAITAVALGACIVEKHLTMSRHEPGPDSSFSLEPSEFEGMVKAVREAERALGRVRYGPSDHEIPSTAFRRSLFVVRNISAGESFTTENVRSIRPANGMPPKYLEEVLGRKAARDIERGTPLTWDLVVTV